MTRATIVLFAATVLAFTAAPATVEAGGYVGVGIGAGGFSLSFGGTNWGVWGSSWSSGDWSVGFTTSLSGYGEWVYVDGLGRVWRPWVAADWRPFSHGRWVWTSMGWTWVAYEPWGWIPHHYGNWAYTTVGWVWTPGYTYHPGNVVWVNAGAYVGWIPSAPHGWSHAHRAYHHGWRDGYSWGHHDGYNRGYRDGWRDAHYATWVPRNRVTADNVAVHAVGRDVINRSIARSRVTPLPAPPSKHEVERMTGRTVTRTRIETRTARIDGRDVRVVRPQDQLDSVRRHGPETVKRALDERARERVLVPDSGRGTSADRSRSRSITRSRSVERSTSSGTTTRRTDDRRSSRKFEQKKTGGTSSSSRRTPVATAPAGRNSNRSARSAGALRPPADRHRSALSATSGRTVSPKQRSPGRVKSTATTASPGKRPAAKGTRVDRPERRSKSKSRAEPKKADERRTKKKRRHRG